MAYVLASEVADLVHSAAFIGYGSEVLGYDTLRSTDPEVSSIPIQAGSVDQVTNNTNVL